MNQMALGRRQASEDFEELFRVFDADKSSSLDMGELSAYLKHHWSAGATPAQARKIMRRSDTNADFSLNLDEFLGCASDVAACESESPQIAQPTKASEEAAAAHASPSSLGLDISLTDFLPDEWASALRPGQVERCTERDRVIMRGQGLTMNKEDAASEPELDPTHTQTLQVKGTWVQTLLMPTTCRDNFAHAGRVDRPKHAQCLQDSLNITLPCARCNTNFFYNMVHNCANACTPSMNSKACVECTRPEKLMECVEGKARFAEMELAAGDFQGDAEEGGDHVVLGGDTITGELILVQKQPAEVKVKDADAGTEGEEVTEEPVEEEETGEEEAVDEQEEENGEEEEVDESTEEAEGEEAEEAEDEAEKEAEEEGVDGEEYEGQEAEEAEDPDETG